MSELDQYVDARSLLHDYRRAVCPSAECGVDRWFRYSDPPYDDPYWVCETCGEHEHDTLELPCPECNTRLDIAGPEAFCNVESCSYDSRSIPKSELIDRLSGEFEARGMARGLMGECPVCGERMSVSGDPDGTLQCSECENFYAGRFSDTWYCYAIWMNTPECIRVNV
jgi:hypothetical protein